MKTIVKIIVFAILVKLGVDLLGYVYEDTYLYCLLYDFWIFVCGLPVIRDIIDFIYFSGFTVSELITIAVIVLGILYVIIHLIEIIIKGLASLLGREHEPFQSKHHVKTLFLSAIFVKVILLAIKLVIVFTQAWGISRFFHWVLGDPVSVYHILINDAMFFIVLIIVLAVSLFRPQQEPMRQTGNYYYHQ